MLQTNVSLICLNLFSLDGISNVFRNITQMRRFPRLRNWAERGVNEAVGEEVGNFGGCVGGLVAGHFGADGVEVHEPALEQALDQFLQSVGGLAI